MRGKVTRLGIGMILVLVITLTIRAVSYSETGVTGIVRNECPVPPVYDSSTIPQSLADDLACRVGFIISRIPDLKVVLAGESTSDKNFRIN